ncbi:MAG TPA: peptidoglycan editing factor PgeF [Prolixibacteraceae bacterium]|nr:peptidoglycan editing factor PgeF [Prolixibacteraceae bacterium]
MHKKHSFVHYPIFESYQNLVAFTSTKQSFATEKTRFTGDSPEIYTEPRKQLAEKLGIDVKQLVFPRQTHTDCVAEIDGIPNCEITETDALVTNQKGICICVQTADCVPVLLFDPKKLVIAAVHAGWRGTVKKIAAVAVQKMTAKFGSDPANIIAAIGPSVSPAIYEVGSEVTEAVLHSIPNAEKTIRLNSSGKNHIDLWEANRQVLLEAGLLIKSIEIIGECSFLENDKYFSARKEGAETGRMVSGIMLL